MSEVFKAYKKARKTGFAMYALADNDSDEVNEGIEEFKREVSLEFYKDAYEQLEAENKELREQISALMATINMLEKSLDDCRNR